MTKNGDSEFKGSTKEAINDLKGDMADVKKEVSSLNKRFLIILILLVVAVIERLPTILSLALAGL